MMEECGSDEFIKQRLEFFKYRTVEELYDVKNDPDGLHNLLNDKKHEQVVQRYRTYMKQWMESQNSSALDIFKQPDNNELRKKYMVEQQDAARKKKH